MSFTSDIRTALDRGGLRYLIKYSPDYLRQKTRNTLQNLLHLRAGVLTRDQLVAKSCNSNAIWRYGDPKEIYISPPHSDELPEFLEELVGTHEIPPSFVCEVRNARLKGKRAICQTKDGKYILEEMGTEPMLRANLSEWSSSLSISQRFSEVTTPCHNEDQRTKYDTIINLVPRHGVKHKNYVNFGHWLLEDLPRLRAFDYYNSETGRRPLILVKENPPGWMLKMLELLGFSSSDWVEWVGDDVAVSRLVVPKLNYVHSKEVQLQPSDRRWVSERMKSRIDLTTDQNFPQRVFVSRQGQSQRSITNFDEVMRALREFGFEAVRPEEFSVEDQIRLFHQAEILVGASGSGMANTVFAEDATLIEIMPQEANISVWFAITNEQNNQYDYLRAKTVGENTMMSGRASDIIVNTDELVEVVQKVINGRSSTT